MQMNRIMVKDVLDISKGRYKGFFGENSFTNKVSKISYYGAIQSAIFAGLQTGLFALMVNSEDDDLTVCKDRGYLVTILYKDNFSQSRYHEKRFKKPRRVGELIDFKL